MANSARRAAGQFCSRSCSIRGLSSATQRRAERPRRFTTKPWFSVRNETKWGKENEERNLDGKWTEMNVKLELNARVAPRTGSVCFRDSFYGTWNKCSSRCRVQVFLFPLWPLLSQSSRSPVTCYFRSLKSVALRVEGTSYVNKEHV